MKTLIFIMTAVYVGSALALALYAAGTLVLLALWWRHRRDDFSAPRPAEDDWPTVTVQLPVFNEREVIGRLIDAVAAFDYPRAKLRVQVLDDSTDDTRLVVAQRVERFSRAGLDITHLRRTDRRGYKAGALAAALEQTDSDLIAILDADFVPPPDFLRRVVPHFLADPRLGMVQTRWGHLNAEENLLTRGQALSLDGHFVIEQTARSRGGLLLSFNGAGGVWRAVAIRDAGGWSDATLTEDLDLSYRAQLKGWRFRYLPDVVVPAEVPPQIAAYKRQQARWAKGNTQVLLRLLPEVWRCPHFTLAQKCMGTLHLCQYLVHPLMLALLLLTLPMLITSAIKGLSLAPLGLAGLGPPLLYVLSQRTLYPDGWTWARRMLAFPALMALGTGLALTNTLAVLSALLGQPNVFQRTPKFRGQSWQQSGYALHFSWTTFGEAALAVYALWCGMLMLRFLPSLAPFLFLYAYAFGTVALWGLAEGLQLWLAGRNTTLRGHPA